MSDPIEPLSPQVAALLGKLPPAAVAGARKAAVWDRIASSASALDTATGAAGAAAAAAGTASTAAGFQRTMLCPRVTVSPLLTSSSKPSPLSCTVSMPRWVSTPCPFSSTTTNATIPSPRERSLGRDRPRRRRR